MGASHGRTNGLLEDYAKKGNIGHLHFVSCSWLSTYTVHVYSGTPYSRHHWDQVKLSALSRCPVFKEYSSTGGVAQNKLCMPGNDPYLMLSTWMACFRDCANFSESQVVWKASWSFS